MHLRLHHSAPAQFGTVTLGLALALGLLTGCGAADTTTSEQSPGASATASSPSGQASGTGDTENFLAEYGLEGKDTVEIIDTLDQNTEQARDLRERGLIASVRMDQLVLKDNSGAEHSLPMPTDRTYVSFAPYVNQTHDCFNHSLTTCQGEMVEKPVKLTIKDDSGQTVKDEDLTTYGNGFVGVWLPRDLSGEVTVEADGKTATAPLSTTSDAPTCVTTIQLT